MSKVFGWPGKVADTFWESAVIAGCALRQGAAWLTNINRLRVLGYTEREYPDCFKQMDGGDKRIMRAFLDPESLSNTYSLLGGKQGTPHELRLPIPQLVRFGQDAFGTESAFDNSFVERQQGADSGTQRWFFINGIATSRDMAHLNVSTLHNLFRRPFTLIHNPTQGLTSDLIESALQKFTNINTEPVARAFLEIGNALLEKDVSEVVVIAHSQGTIIMGDVLDLIYCSIDRKYFDRTNMNDEDFEQFMRTSSGTVKSGELLELKEQLRCAGPELLAKLELYMFANGASRMCYLDKVKKYPHIESFANEHDIVTRLGSLARQEFHKEDLIRIDGSLFTNDRFGHLLNAHYLPDFVADKYQHSAKTDTRCVGTSIHDTVLGNPCLSHPKHIPGPTSSKLFKRYRDTQGQVPDADDPGAAGAVAVAHTVLLSDRAAMTQRSPRRGAGSA